MSTDVDTGIDPVAKDGEVDEEKVSDLAARRTANGGGSAAARGEQAQLDGEPPIDEADDGQFFVWEQGRKVTLGTLIARGIPVEHAFVFGGKRLKGRGGLMGFDDDVLVLSRGRVGKTSLVPSRDDEEKVTKVVVETHIRANVVMPADSEEAVALLRPIFERRSTR